MSKKRKISPKSKEYVKEAVDIVRNTEDDKAALEFLKNTLDDDFPDLDLGSMDLHEAIKVLGIDKKTGDRKRIENLNDSLGEFLEIQKQKKESKRKNKKRNKKVD